MSGQDLGTDTGSTAINLGLKIGENILQALMKLLEKIWQTWKDAPKRKLEKAQISEYKESQDKAKALKKLEGIEGEIAYDKLKKISNAIKKPIVATGVRFSDSEDLNRFAELAKRSGLVWTGLLDPSMNVGQQVTHIQCLSTYVEKVKQICDLISDEKRVSAIDKKIAEIMENSKGELSDIDKANIENLESTKQKIIDKYTGQFNERAYADVINNALNPNEEEKSEEKDNSHGEEKENNSATEKGTTEEKIKYQTVSMEDSDKESTLAKALDMDTSRAFDVGRTMVIVDSTEPNRYVVCASEKSEFHGKEYTKTDYEVHNPNGKVFKCNDERFEGRPKDYWSITKKNMLAQGGFAYNATLLKFGNMQDFLKWQARTTRENEAEQTKRDLTKNYEEHIAKNKAEIDKLGFEVREDGELYHKKYNQKAVDMVGDKRMANSTDPIIKLQMLNTTEAIVLNKQLQTLEQLKKIEEELAVAKVEQITAETPEEKKLADEKLAKIESEKSSLVEMAKSDDNTRSKLNALENEAREEIRKQQRVNEMGDEKDWDEEQFKKDDQMYGEQEPNGRGQDGVSRGEDGVEKRDTEEDRGDEGSTMSDWENDINEEKKKDASEKGGEEHDKGNKGRDSKPKSHDDRAD